MFAQFVLIMHGTYCCTGKKTKLSIISTLAWTFGPAYSVCCVYQLAYSVLQFANPQVFD